MTRPNGNPRTVWLTRPMCETCWTQRTSEVPYRLAQQYRKAERCYVCGAETWSGIYVRAPEEGTG